MHNKTLSQQLKDLAAGEYSSEELTRHYLERIQRLDPQINSYITITEQQALQQAQASDKRRREGQAGLLEGIPLAHKDIFCTDGIRTSCGSKMLDNFIAPYDATVVSNMSDAGVVSLGKLNMDEFAMGSSNETSWYGPVRNPWHTDFVPGGSSGGSAAAVAAGLASASTGTDTGGSIRQPAAHCGLTGLKPTYGRVSRYGMIAFASSLDQAGPMARSAEDAAYLLQSMAGLDPRDSTSMDHAVPDYVAGLKAGVKGLRIGVPAEFFADGLHPDVDMAVRKALSQLESEGAELVEISLPRTELAVPCYYVIAPAEASANLSRFDGVRYGYRCENPKDLDDLYTRTRAEGFGGEVKRRIMVGAYALSAGYYDAYYRKAQQIRRLIHDDFQRVFEQVDVIAGPTSPNPAFRLGEKIDDPLSMYLEDLYTIPVNLAGLPAISVPAGFSGELPIGLQLIAPKFEECRLLSTAHHFQQLSDWHQRMPSLFTEAN